MSLLFIFGLICFVLGVLLYRRRKRVEHREQLLKAGLSDTERKIVADTVPLLRNLPPDMQTRLEGKMNLFLDQVEFIGCNGLDVTEEMELSIAAQACLLVLNTDAWYDHLRTILIYPGAFKSKTREHDGYVVRESEVVRSGESWQYGPVILSWAHSKQGALNTEDGHNVVLHEFAHQLDGLSGHTDGAPLLANGQSFAEWERVFTTGYERHVKKTEAGHKTVLSPYAATNHEEFFAVAVEVFFEKATQLQSEEPEVYAQLSELLQLDPATWQ
ncbi:zinc-dependent peptidase [Roseovarius phycicola]|uniref:M90 family metallopeptidase n=1 Tax=Roseovarius phycicola TaxID=3080976 RepID=A0ABZ2HIL8_9RHOB